MRPSILNSPMFRAKQSNRALKRLIIINIVVFIIANICISYSVMNGGNGAGFLDNIALSDDVMTVLKKPWTLFTSMFTHLGFWHILFNMLYLWWFGKILRESYGGQSIIASYILGALVGAIAYIAFYELLMPSEVSALAIGASGGVTAVMVAAAVINPNRIMNLFLLGPVKIKWIVLTLFVLSSVINFHENTGGKVDHIGGAIFGLVYAYYLRKGKNITPWFDKFMSFLARTFRIRTDSSVNRGKKRNSAFRGAMDRRPQEFRELTKKNFATKDERKKEMDALLDKVSKMGYDKLSQKEKDRLAELSKEY